MIAEVEVERAAVKIEPAKKTFDDKWIKMIHAWDWFRDPQKCESLTYEEMPYQKEELK